MCVSVGSIFWLSTRLSRAKRKEFTINMNLKRLFVYQLLVACVLLLGMNVALWGQGATATVTGRVTDATGAILPGSNVTITDTATNVQHKTATNNAGEYNVPLLPPGTYRVEVEAKGFKSEAQTGITLQVGQTVGLNYKLELGEVSQTVQVEGAAVQLQTQSAETGVVVPNTQIIELPLNGRQYYSLVQLTPGTYPPAQNSSLSFRGGFNVAGSSEVANNFRLDGFNNNDPATSSPAFAPSLDGIQEFNLLTGVYSAQYGTYSGGQVLVVSKSGTNEIHGTAFDYIRNQVLDAQNFFNGPTSKPSFVRNEFGGTVGGPIIKNKLFAFVSYEGLRLHQDISALATVPTTAMAQGDFSSFLPANDGGTANPNSFTLVNPLTAMQQIANNNVAASGLENPIGVALAALYPAPTFATVPGTLPANNYNFNENRVENMNEIAARADYTIDAANSVYVTFGRQNDPSFEPSNPVCGQSVLPGFGCNVGALGYLAGISYSHIFTPALVNQFLASWNQFAQPRVQQDVANNFVGNNNIPGVFDGIVPNNTGVPNVQVGGLSQIAPATGEPQARTDDSYQFTDGVTYTHGRHTLTMGFQYNRFLYSLFIVEDGRGDFNFEGAPAPASGNTFADLLFGTPSQTVQVPTAPLNHPRQTFFNGYVQDDWKVTPTLTFNLGLRYEYFGSITDKDNRYSSFDPVGAGIMQVSGQTTGGFPENLYSTQRDNFAPRIGFSWQLPNSTKTVLRGGFGYFYDNVTAGNGFLGLGINPPFREPAAFNATTLTPISLSDPYPNTIDGATSVTPTGVIQNFKTPLTTEWSLGLQHQFTSTLLGDVTYFGTKGTYLPLNYNNNQPLPSAGAQPLPRPFPNFGNTTFIVGGGNSSYQSLQVKLEQRYSHGLLFIASYTWARSIDNGAGIATGSSASSNLPQNFRDLNAERGPSDFNIDDHFTFSPVYELPFGKGRKWLQSGIPNILAGGWQATGIVTIQTGSPFTVNLQENNSNTFNFEDRPNQIGNPDKGPKTVNEWFNTAAFVIPPFGSFGDAHRNSVTGPGFKDVDFSLSRFFPVVPNRVKAEFRAEIFNIVNHPNFGLPNAALDGQAFGAITNTGTTGTNNSRQIEFALRLTF
jgi:hypothetical protein